MYNVISADAEHGIKAGDNVAWDGSTWDVLAGTMDLSQYATKDDLDGKVDKAEGSRLMTQEEAEKLTGIEAGANANILEVIQANGTALPIVNKTVNIPMATAEALGLVKSSEGENSVAVAADGTMTVNSLNVNRLVQTPGESLILNGGDSSGV